MNNHVRARLGTFMSGQCIALIDWSGRLETFQHPRLNTEGTILSFPLTDANAYDRNGRPLNIKQLTDLIKRVTETNFNKLKVDLNDSRNDIEGVLTRFIPAENSLQVKSMLDTLKFGDALAGESALTIKIAFDVPVLSGRTIEHKPAERFSEAEMKQWREAWQEWDGFLTDAINQATADAKSEEIRDTLLDILLEARGAFQAGLTNQPEADNDPVRIFFHTTWERLSPTLRSIAQDLPGTEGLRYLTFIAATDVLYELETIGAPAGLDISSDGLRRLARLLIAKRNGNVS
ncbi:MAG: hypothetical protein ACU84J_08485 [Gammaproteobacteria bacterium]